MVRDWLAAGTAEVCLAVADEQTAGRGRDGRRWESPAGAALLLSLGFRPDWLPPDRAWRLVATASLAMADAAEEVGGLADGAIRLKWPNDLVVEGVDGGGVRKLAGLLGETDGLGTDDPRVVVGLGINADWAPADFPPALVGSMTSLREASGGRPVELGRAPGRVPRPARGPHRGAAWRPLRRRRLDHAAAHDRARRPGGRPRRLAGRRSGRSGWMPRPAPCVVADADAPGGERQVLVGEIVHIRLADPATSTSGV